MFLVRTINGRRGRLLLFQSLGGDLATSKNLLISLLKVQYLGLVVLACLVENHVMRYDVRGRVDLKRQVDGVRRNGHRLVSVMRLGIWNSHSLRERLEGK